MYDAIGISDTRAGRSPPRSAHGELHLIARTDDAEPSQHDAAEQDVRREAGDGRRPVARDERLDRGDHLVDRVAVDRHQQRSGKVGVRRGGIGDHPAGREAPEAQGQDRRLDRELWEGELVPVPAMTAEERGQPHELDHGLLRCQPGQPIPQDSQGGDELSAGDAVKRFRVDRLQLHQQPVEVRGGSIGRDRGDNGRVRRARGARSAAGDEAEGEHGCQDEIAHRSHATSIHHRGWL